MKNLCYICLRRSKKKCNVCEMPVCKADSRMAEGVGDKEGKNKKKYRYCLQCCDNLELFEDDIPLYSPANTSGIPDVHDKWDSFNSRDKGKHELIPTGEVAVVDC